MRLSTIIIAQMIGSAVALAAATQPAAPAIWIEGEDAVRTNFSPGSFIFVGGEDGASGGRYLRLDVPGSAAKPPFFAEWEFAAASGGEYRLWISGSPQDSGGIAPLYVRIDDGPFVALRGRSWVGESYGTDSPYAYFGWFMAEAVRLKAGKHTIRIEAREPRTSDGLYAAFIDAMFLTSDPAYVPAGNHPSCSPHPTWSELMKRMTHREYVEELTRKQYWGQIGRTSEDARPETAAEVRRKISVRPLPSAQAKRSRPSRFGLHGMSYSFIEVGKHEAETAAAYDLLARAGVESFRTTESFWFQLGPKFDDFEQLDYQAGFAAKYGQTFMFMTGYPDPQFSVAPERFSAVKAEHEELFRQYLRAVFSRYPGMVEIAEFGNEVDAPEVWWRGATPEIYVRQIEIVREEVKRIDPSIRIAAFAATYSRDEATGAPDGGRAFVRKCLDLGVDRFADVYTMHYTWSAGEWDLPAFFRRELSARGLEKELINSEESAGRPCDMVKMFARDFYLHGFPRVDYYLARDWYENGHLCPYGLFDIDWNPKLRLLPFALSVDAMRDRRLVGMAEPVEGVEAYVLEREPGTAGDGPEYALVFWDDRAEGGAAKADRAVKVGGVRSAVSAFTWRLDSVSFDPKAPEFVLTGDEPLVVFAAEKPDWELVSAAEWVERRAKE